MEKQYQFLHNIIINGLPDDFKKEYQFIVECKWGLHNFSNGSRK